MKQLFVTSEIKVFSANSGDMVSSYQRDIITNTLNRFIDCGAPILSANTEIVINCLELVTLLSVSDKSVIT